MPLTLSDLGGADLISAVAALSKQERLARLDEAFRVMAAAQGEVVAIVGEVDRAQEYRDEGAPSTESWLVERYGLSTSTARALTHVAEKAWDIPQLVGSLSSGEVSFDKVRVLADVATSGTDRELCDQARECSVRELADIARSEAQLTRTGSVSSARSEHDRRFLRFNDTYRTLTAQLPADSYAETKASLEARAKDVPTEGETPWDQRLCDGFLGLIRSCVPGAGGRASTASPYVVVAHVPLAALVEDSGEKSALAGELEYGGLIDADTVRRIACDATVVGALDDDEGALFA